jgi:16S rRNA (cytidine1402-2'-O)-methyltransferase
MLKDLNKESGLYVTATPIGNLGDITIRAIETLKSVDFIACEDTRVTSKLLRHFGIKTPLIAYHEHNANEMRPKIIKRLHAGQKGALVSDAGTPLVSDPGFKLVDDVKKEGLKVTPIPGVSAPITALMVAGLPSDRFLFEGFLPNKTGARKKTLETLTTIPATLMFFESPKRLSASLCDMVDVFGGNRLGSVCRELTKLFEEVKRDTLENLFEYYSNSNVKGEIVILIEPPQIKKTEISEAKAIIKTALETLSTKEASHVGAYLTGLPRKQLYKMALDIKAEKA